MRNETLTKNIWINTRTQFSEIWKVAWSGQYLLTETESCHLAPHNQYNRREGEGPELCDNDAFVKLPKKEDPMNHDKWGRFMLLSISSTILSINYLRSKLAGFQKNSHCSSSWNSLKSSVLQFMAYLSSKGPLKVSTQHMCGVQHV
jgi:hypothetical protein